MDKNEQVRTIGPDSKHWARESQITSPGGRDDYLDTITAQDTVRLYKQESYRLMGVRPGVRLLDVGCGTGDDVLALAEMVGPTGFVAGVDSNAALIALAKERSQGKNLPLEFRTGNAYELPFDDNSFDGSRIDRTLQHLTEPRRALAEMIRVVRPGGPVVAIDPDWETLIFDMPDEALTRKIVTYNCGRLNQGWCGRQLRRLFLDVSLTDVSARPVSLIVTDYTLANHIYAFEDTVADMQNEGEITAAEANGWLSYLKYANRNGRFFNSITAFVIRGIKP